MNESNPSATTHVLIIDKAETMREVIVDSFRKAEARVNISESKSFSRAFTIFKDTKIDCVIIGPSHFAKETISFIKNLGSLYDRPFIGFYMKEDTKQRTEYEAAPQIKALPFPPDLEDISKILSSEIQSPPSNTNLTAMSPGTSASTLKTASKRSDFDQIKALAVVFSRLSSRLNQVSKMLLDLPETSSLAAPTISEAVNTTITGATRLRSGKEDEDLQILVNSLIKKKDVSPPDKLN